MLFIPIYYTWHCFEQFCPTQYRVTPTQSDTTGTIDILSGRGFSQCGAIATKSLITCKPRMAVLINYSNPLISFKYALLRSSGRPQQNPSEYSASFLAKRLEDVILGRPPGNQMQQNFFGLLFKIYLHALGEDIVLHLLDSQSADALQIRMLYWNWYIA